ncbi:MAG: hypothetical protein MUO82_04600 [Candidatus Thermoplasmatota archaeon]|nr:hypothetical protein [Candidatus Thermoplasmatota archaeon]
MQNREIKKISIDVSQFDEKRSNGTMIKNESKNFTANCIELVIPICFTAGFFQRYKHTHKIVHSTFK